MRKVIKEGKRKSWRKYCRKLGAETSVREVWKAVHRIAGIVRSSRVPISESDGRSVIVDKKKASEFDYKFRTVHSGDNLEEGLRRRKETLKQQMHKLEGNEDNTDPCNLYFSSDELKKKIA